MTWSYAKDVGMVKVEVRMQLESEPPVTISTMELVSFTPATTTTTTSPG